MDLLSHFEALQTAYKTAPYLSLAERQKILLALKSRSSKRSKSFN